MFSYIHNLIFFFGNRYGVFKRHLIYVSLSVINLLSKLCLHIIKIVERLKS